MSSFDRLTKGLASGGLSRRSTLKLVLGGAAAAALSAIGVAGAGASSDSPDVAGSFCPLSCAGVPGSTCGVSNCPNCGNSNCYCFPLGQNVNDTRCGCNFFCSTAAFCSSNADCPAQHFCSQTCCTGGMVCVQHCTSTCALGAAPANGDTRKAA